MCINWWISNIMPYFKIYRLSFRWRPWLGHLSKVLRYIAVQPRSVFGQWSVNMPYVQWSVNTLFVWIRLKFNWVNVLYVQWGVNMPYFPTLRALAYTTGLDYRPTCDVQGFYCRATMQCIRAIECEYALCSLFAPGDRHVIIGTKVCCCLLYKAQSLWFYPISPNPISPNPIIAA